MNFGLWYFSVSWDVIAPEVVSVDHTILVDPNLFGKCRAESLCDATLDLAAALHGIQYPAGVSDVHAAKNLDISCFRFHGDSEPLRVEGYRSRGAVAAALGTWFMSGFAHSDPQVDQRQPRTMMVHRVPLEPAEAWIGPNVVSGENYQIPP